MELSGDTGAIYALFEMLVLTTHATLRSRGDLSVCTFGHLDFSERRKLPMQAGWTR